MSSIVLVRFGNGPLRAYYHVHPGPLLRREEHGHFHLFVAVPREDDMTWCHVAGLGMDREGQPIRWFTTNHWVTGGSWLPAKALFETIRAALGADTSGCSLLERWLAGMLGLSLPDLPLLLRARDAALAAQSRDRAQAEVLQDRAICELSEHPVDLLVLLQSRLSAQVESRLPKTNENKA